MSVGSENIVCHSNFVRNLVILSVLAIGFSYQALAQDATVLGTVTDPSGAAVPNITVTVTNVDTGQSAQFKTNGEVNS